MKILPTKSFALRGFSFLALEFDEACLRIFANEYDGLAQNLLKIAFIVPKHSIFTMLKQGF